MWSLIQTHPKRSAFADAQRASRRPVSRPRRRARTGVPFAQAIASSSSLKRWTVITGPKISRWISSSSWRSPASTVGSRKKPGPSGFAAPVTTSTCLPRRSKQTLDRSRWRAEFSGPSVVSVRERVAEHEADVPARTRPATTSS